MDQELTNCNIVYDIAIYKRAFVTIKKYNVNKSRHIQIRLFTKKKKESLKQVAHVNYTSSELKKLSQN